MSQDNSLQHFDLNKLVQNSLAPIKPKPPRNSTSEITAQQFLDFLKTAYQVQDTLEGANLSEGITEVVDWIKLKESELVKPTEASVQTSETKLGAAVSDGKSSVESSSSSAAAPEEAVRNKLGEVIGEGIFDSVLPFLVPATVTTSVPAQMTLRKAAQATRATTDKPSASSSSGGSSKECLPRKKSLEAPPTTTAAVSKTDSEVEIHVCDELKNMKKDFVCNQRLLVEKMGYFAEVTTGQRLEDMDISVHCDITIFDWLMRWVKKDSLLEQDWPVLDAHCVVPVLVSAAFLKMEPLLEECLLYCHEHMNDILRTNTNLSCINETVLTRLAAMYTNAEVECIRDRKDKIQSRLFFKLIRSLIEPVPESVRGHWMSLAKVFRCGKCRQLVGPAVAQDVPCVAGNMMLQPDGKILSYHSRDPQWNIKDYCLKLLKNYKTWRKVYWRLWGDAHFLYCLVCHKFFPAHQIGWCRYHPDPPQFFSVDTQRAPLPIGRYPCCGERAYRFQLLDDRSGCKFREHQPCTMSVRDSSVVNMLATYRHLIEVEPPELMFPERLTRLVARDSGTGNDGKLECRETFWWDGLMLLAPRPRLGLLGAFLESLANKELTLQTEETSEDPSSESDCTSFSSRSTNAWESSSTCATEESPVPTPRSPRSKKNKRKIKNPKYKGRLWQHNLSIRSNQDLQRANEETTMKKMISVLCRRVAAANESRNRGNKGMARHLTPTGGLWVRLENEWKENTTYTIPQKMRNIFTGKARLLKPGGKMI